MRLFFFLSFTLAASAQSNLDRPRLGIMLDPTGTARPVFGTPASVTLGDPAARDVLSIACSSQLCLIKTRTAIHSSTGQTIDAPPGPAIFALTGNTALICFPLSRQCAQWNNGVPTPIAADITGQLLSLRVRDGAPEFAVRRNQATWIVDASDRPLDSIPSGQGPVMLLAGGVLYATPTETILRRHDGSEIRFPVEGAEAFFALSEAYVQIRARHASFAIRTTSNREQMFELPEPPAGKVP